MYSQRSVRLVRPSAVGSQAPELRLPRLNRGLPKTHCHGIAVEELFFPFLKRPTCLRFADQRLRMPDLDSKRERLLQLFASYGSCAVAFSAGVDSTVVAKAACMAIGDRAVAVTGTSASLAAGELDEARRLAALIGIRHLVIDTHEFRRPEYLQNSFDRCYHCKTELYTRLDGLRDRLGVEVVCNGANLDDLADYRPGMRAADEHQVQSPLAECGLTKADVRRLAEAWQLPIWDKPATPCLSSRVAYGEAVTPERLAMVDRAEQFLKSRGFRVVRVRYHRGELARVEVPAEELARLADATLREEIVGALTSLGFRFITLDLQGFRSGSMNSLVQIGAASAAT